MKRSLIAVFAILTCLTFAWATGAGRPYPASAGGVIDPTCTSSLPCIEYDNNGTGPGIRGISLLGNGLSGSTKNKSTSTANGRAGLMGNDVGTGNFNAGVHGLSVSGTGVSGQSTSGLGVSGISTSGSGVFGMSSGSVGAGVLGSSSVFVGVEGNTGAQTASGGRAAIEGTNNKTSAAIRANGFGGNLFVGNNSGGTDVFTVDDSGNMTATGQVTLGANTTGIAVQAGNSSVNFGFAGKGHLKGVVGESFGDPGTFLQAGVEGDSSDFPSGIAVLAAGSAGTLFEGLAGGPAPVFTVDTAGNVHGHSFTSDLAVSANQQIETYGSQESEPAVEDFGEAQLTNGSAYVRLETRFATIIARGLNYLVFITPEGDSHGLFVTQKSAQGFAVHENQGGHSTLAFSYRIVAKPLGNQQPRLPLVDVHIAPRLAPRLPSPLMQPRATRIPKTVPQAQPR